MPAIPGSSDKDTRERLIAEAYKLLQSTPTDILISYLPVLGQYADKAPILRLVRNPDPGDTLDE